MTERITFEETHLPPYSHSVDKGHASKRIKSSLRLFES